MRPDPRMLASIGDTGLRRYAGTVDEELHRQLSGTRAVATYREMADNDSTIAAVMAWTRAMIRRVRWSVEPAAQGREEEKWAGFLEECLRDMEMTWGEVVEEALSELVFGWSALEIVYKLRNGPAQKDRRFRSAYDDGLVGWRKLAPRAQESLHEWEWDEEGDVRAMVQLPPSDYRLRTIPADRLLLFRVGASKNNPEGRSPQRGAYRAWWFLKRLQEIEAVGMERDLAGLPVVDVPPQLLSSGATAEEKALVASLAETVQKVRRNEREGVVFPAERYADPSTGATVESGFRFRLLTSGGRQAGGLREAVKSYQQDIARVFLAEFIFLGSASGSRALADSKTDMFAAAMEGYLSGMAETLNRSGVARLMEINGVPRECWPRLVPDPFDVPALEAISRFVTELSRAGILSPGPRLERHLRRVADLPDEEESPDALLGSRVRAGTDAGAAGGLADILARVEAGTLAPETAAAAISAGFGLSDEAADAVVAAVAPKTPAAEPPAGG